MYFSLLYEILILNVPKMNLKVRIMQNKTNNKSKRIKGRILTDFNCKRVFLTLSVDNIVELFLLLYHLEVFPAYLSILKYIFYLIIL